MELSHSLLAILILSLVSQGEGSTTDCFCLQFGEQRMGLQTGCKENTEWDLNLNYLTNTQPVASSARRANPSSMAAGNSLLVLVTHSKRLLLTSLLARTRSNRESMKEVHGCFTPPGVTS